MSVVLRVAKNSFFVLATRLMEVVFNLLIFALVARYLGVQGFGVYSLVIASIWVLSPLIFMGLNQVLPRDISQRPEAMSQSVRHAMVLNLVMAAPVCALSVAAVYAFGMDYASSAGLMICVATFVLKGFIRNFDSVYIATEKMEYLALANFAPRLCEFLLIGAVVYFDLGYLYLFIASFAAELTGVAAYLYLARGTVSFSGSWVDTYEIKALIKEALPVMVSIFLAQAFLYVNIFVLKLLAGDSDVALYQGPQKILTRLQLLVMALFIPILPIYSRLAASEELAASFDMLLTKSVKWILVFSLCATVVGVALADTVNLLLFGEAFAEAGAALKILMLALPFFCLTTLQRYILLVLKKQRLTVISDAACVVVSAALGALLVPGYGFIGASAATVAAVAAQFLINSVMLFDRIRRLSLQGAVFGPVAASILLAIPVFGYGRPESVLKLLFGMALFCLGLVIFKTISKEDLLIFRRRKAEELVLQKAEKN